MTVPEAARQTGFSRWTILRAVRDGRIRAVQLGRAIRIAKPDLDAAVREWERSAVAVSVHAPTYTDAVIDRVFNRSRAASRKGTR
ncbi:MAG TPA: excisionase family DNA-binding protein [Thermoanaerobaculia bacterium]|nr:excisionase family DNA-binding protein [Thermoanaerobaculia bacterium]